VSKTVTANAAMMLYDEGRFGLDDNIDDYLPFSVENPNCAGTPITFRQLLTHTSSILDNIPIYEASYTIGDSPIALGDFVRGYVEPGGAYYDADENFADECPGTIDDYSNVAIGLLGYLVEQIAGQPFDQFCRDRIFAPLGMTDTSFRLADLDEAKVAMPYDRTSGHFVAHGHSGFPTYPDGLLRTSVPHLARFLAMNADLGDLGGTRILTESTAREMRRIQVPDLDDTQGLIWFYDDFGTHLDLLGHDGDDPGTSSLMFYDPTTGDGALLVANGYWYDADDDSPEADAVLTALFDEAGRLP
jgi:CubicO group peptidase (beta-lactamase class C family)